ncbi:hypothetical protein VIBNISOn1_p0198 [Vibrio nigripulchritudo SOn1]|uniref:Uncharacterized protein n=2 Tax=Vibrio nigripulchritudo TaxID=28173 RepID=A0AAV2W206_9VIBR|nr:hypothetical protein VIBNISOn1_p0198 [Vibrio nigripulchritudo SOn1]
MVTLKASENNEFSHKLGHYYGLESLSGGINRKAKQCNPMWE